MAGGREVRAAEVRVPFLTEVAGAMVDLRGYAVLCAGGLRRRYAFAPRLDGAFAEAVLSYCAVTCGLDASRHTRTGGIIAFHVQHQELSHWINL